MSSRGPLSIGGLGLLVCYNLFSYVIFVKILGTSVRGPLCRMLLSVVVLVLVYADIYLVLYVKMIKFLCKIITIAGQPEVKDNKPSVKHPLQKVLKE